MTMPPWWDSAFTARFPLSVTAPADYSLTVDASMALAVGPDVRVVVHDTTAHEIDRVLASPSITFKVPATGSVWLYAGPGTGTPKSDPKQVYLFDESFDELAVDDDGSGPFIPQPAGSWKVVDDSGNHVYRAIGTGRNPAAIRGLMPTDFEIEARMRVNTGGIDNHNGIMGRGNSMDPNTLDGFVGQLQINGQRMRIAEYVDGASPPDDLAGVDRIVSRSVWYALRLRIIGNAVTFYVDGQQIGAASQTSDGNFAGLFAYSCDVDFDDVRVKMAANPAPAATIGARQDCN